MQTRLPTEDAERHGNRDATAHLTAMVTIAGTLLRLKYADLFKTCS